MAAQDWDIKKGSPTCTGCEKEFVDKESTNSRLCFTEEGYQRHDFCQSCWNEELANEAVSAWKTVYHAPAPPEPEPVQKENAESLLRRLIETDDDDALNTIYILAVMLERKKILVEKDVQLRPDGVKIRFYEHKKSGESFVIRDPELKLAELTSVQEEVIARLEGRKPGDPIIPEGCEAPQQEEPEAEPPDQGESVGENA